MKTAVSLLFVLSTLTCAKCSKILGVFPVPSPSHFFLETALMKGLSEKGHDVTIISPYLEENPPKNSSYRQIHLTGVAEIGETIRKQMNLFDSTDGNMFLFVPQLFKLIDEMAEVILNHTNVQKLLKSEETFDVVILEQFMSEAHKGFAAHFKAPLILFTTIGASSWVNFLVGNPAPTSYVPDALLSYSTHMTFLERTINTLMHVLIQCLYNFYLYPKQEVLYNKYFPTAPSFYDHVLYNISLVLLNSHPSTNHPVPYVPSMIDVGGLHIKPPKKLPKDLQTFLDEAKEGVIYFSMGSNLRSSELSEEKREAFIEAFSKLKQKILWKWEEDVLPGQPENVKLGKWLPQQDILAHPNVKLFITHGGLLSTTETIYHGVPVLAIPITGDQKLNAQRVVSEEFGLLLNYKEISEITLTKKLKELLENSNYTKNAKKKSELYHDRLVDPLDTAIYWVEYVIRHGGAHHLKVAGVDLPWYKYMLVDVILFILLTGLVIFYVFFKITKMIFSFCLHSKVKKIKQN